MQAVSDAWNSLWQSGATLEVVAIINGVEYTNISPPTISRALTQNGLSIGNVVSATCLFSVTNDVTVPKSAEVQIKMRLTGGSDEEPVVSEWRPVGTFYVSRRARDPISGVLTLECYDALLKAEAVLADVPWTTDTGDIVTTNEGEWIYFSITYPVAMSNIAKDMASILGVEIDPRTHIETGGNYFVDGKSASTTIRDVLGQIAAANCGNWIMTAENKMYLLPVKSAPDAETEEDIVEVEAVTGSVYTGDEMAVSGIRSTTDSNSVLIGDDSGLIVDVPVNELIAQTVYRQMVGMTYRPFTLDMATYNPAVELGDYIRYGDVVTSTLMSQEITIGPYITSTISAPDAAEVTDEFPYVSHSSRALADAKSYAAEVVEEAISEYDDRLGQDEVFKKLTNNGEAQGVYLYDGKIYINGTYMQIGTIMGANGKNYWVLDGDDAEFVAQKGAIGAFTLDEYVLSYAHEESDGSVYNVSLSGDGITTQRVVDSEGYSSQVTLRGGRAKFFWNDYNLFDISVGDGFLFVCSYRNGMEYPVQIYSRAGILDNLIRLEYPILCKDEVNVEGDFTVTGTKSRVVSTGQYSDRLLYCYETPSPMFGDVGEGVIGEDGLCYITIDPIFAQTISTNQYQVYLQKYGDGDCWVKERMGAYFIIEGTPGLAFGWEIKAKQADFDQLRMERNDEKFNVPQQTYGEDAAQYIDELRKERIQA